MVKAPRVQAGTRLYAIGDIHGRADLLKALHSLICEDAGRHHATRNVVVYLGDYVDRGPQSRDVVDLLLDEPLPNFEAVHLKGNHEDSMLRFLAKPSVGPAWISYGGAATLISYDVSPPETTASPAELARAQAELARRLPERHRKFLGSLPLTHTEGDYFFVHAGVRPGVAIDQQAEQDLLWIRSEFLSSDKDFGKVVVHGHSITERPDVQRNRIGIDTGAFASDTLTCLVLEDTDCSFLQT
ncbi:MAG TPA: metallophosphoesterase family protein [Stellaceae bacterium]|nr:metallophosphoesterase family protein [Stellaceae bacterium]